MDAKIERKVLSDDSVVTNVILYVPAEPVSSSHQTAIRIACVSSQQAISLVKNLNKASYIEIV